MQKVNKLSLVLITLMAFFRSYAQEKINYPDSMVVYLGEIRLGDTTKDSEKQRVDYKHFYNNYNIYVSQSDGRASFYSPIFPKEDYYNSLHKNTEIRIHLPKILIPAVDNGTRTFLPLIIKFNPKNKEERKSADSLVFLKVDFAILLTKNTSQTSYINENTQKLTEGIEIKAPEEVAIDIVLYYLKERLDRTYDIDDGLIQIVRELDKFPIDSLFTTQPDYPRLVAFSKLFNFIDPFVKSNSFLNEEARKLRLKIDTMGQYSRPLSDTLRAELDFAREIYGEYELFTTRLRGYHDKLKIILFPHMYHWGNGFTYPEKKNRQDNLSKISMRFVVGAGTSYFPQQLYDITISPVDTTVEFEQLSQLYPTLSAGWMWHPFMKKRKLSNPDSTAVKPAPPQMNWSPFSIGGLLDYHLLSLPDRSSINSRLGMSIACGYSIRNFSITGRLGTLLSPVRYPRQFFIDEFNGTNRQILLPGTNAPVTSLSMSDNGLFANKILFTMGISLVFVFN